MLNGFSKLLKTAMAKFSISREGVRYTRYYKSLAADKDILLIDNCKGISDNPEMLKELCNNQNYKALKKYMVMSDSKKVNSEFEAVKPLSRKHLRLLATAGCIISDYLPDFYIRKEEQCYINTNGSCGSLSQMQRNYIISSYIVCKDKPALERIRAEFMLDNIFSGEYIVGESLVNAIDYALICKKNGVETVEAKSLFNGRDNVLIFTGALEKNGITTALKSLVNSLDEQRNYIPFFYEKSVLPNAQTIKEIEKNGYISVCGDMNMSLFETAVLALYFLNIRLIKNTESILDDIYRREIRRCFGDMKTDYVIHFTGYARNVLQLICRMNAKKFVWVHNNMFLESSTKGNVDVNTVRYGYDKCDKIVVVRDTMKEELEGFVEPAQRDKINVVHNLNDIDGIIGKSQQQTEFQEDTYCNVTIERLNEILTDKSVNKLINIARFSKEKGIDRLITAFDKYKSECDSSAYLIIIGGYGEEFEHISSMVDERENIILIKSINNPYPILKQCDLFVLSSHYEGLPMTIMEALILGIPVVSTDITGPREFLAKGYGVLTEDSEQGLLSAMKKYKNGELVPSLSFDARQFNEAALAEFNSLFD